MTLAKWEKRKECNDQKGNSMTPRENLLSLYRRQGIQFAPVEFGLCPSLVQQFAQRYPGQEHQKHFAFSDRSIGWPTRAGTPTDWSKVIPFPIAAGSTFSAFGAVWEPPGDDKCFHLHRLRSPLSDAATLKELQAWPWPSMKGADWTKVVQNVQQTHKDGIAAVGCLEMTIWESAWYVRGMETMFMDMMSGEDGAAERAQYVLDRVTEFAIDYAKGFANVGVDILRLGDDIGMQKTPMMDLELWRTWLKPRLAAVIAAAKQVKPDIVVLYHSCGYVEPFIEDLISIGVDVLNPLQPESMDVEAIIRRYGDRLSFNGGLGTQTTMPHASPAEVAAETKRLLDLGGKKGGIFVCPSHLLEPEVPWENIEAYAAACAQWRP